MFGILRSASPVRLGALLFAVAFLVRIAVIIFFHPYHDLARYELERTAISLATTGVYGNPYAIPTGPTAHVAPGYTLILAALFHLFGTGTTAEIIKELLATAVTSFEIALLPAVAAALSFDRRAGFVAGLIMALYPARPLVEIDGDWETPYIALALMLAAVLAMRLRKNNDLSWKAAIRHGVCWGVALLFVSALLLVFVALIFFEAIWRRKQVRPYFAFALVELAVVAVCLFPWIVRNDLALGFPVVTRSNAGIELRISNNDYAVADQRENLQHGLFNRYHPLQSPSEALKVRQSGEIEYNREARAEATRWISQHPARFLELTLGRIRCFWFYIDPTSRVKTIFLWCVSLCGFAGLVVALRQKSIAGYILGVIVLVYPIPNYLVHVGLRQSYPVEWLMLLLGAGLLSGALQRKHARARELVAVSN